MDPIIRYSPPTRYDTAPYGSICKVTGDTDIYKVYVQVSDLSDSAIWLPIGELLEKTFESFTCDHEFIVACADIFLNKQGSHMQIIVDKIKQ